MRYKEHCLVAEALADEQESSAWKNHDRYKRDLIHLGWTLAHEGGTIPPPEANLLTLSAFNEALQCHSHQLTSQLEAVHRLNTELTKELKCERLDISLRASEADFWQDQHQYLQERYQELEGWLLDSQPRAPSIEDIIKQPEVTYTGEISDQIACMDSTRANSLNQLTEMPLPDKESGPELFNLALVERIAAARNETAPREHEFQAAQHHHYESGERPQTSGTIAVAWQC
jgi:hypothetical protein